MKKVGEDLLDIDKESGGLLSSLEKPIIHQHKIVQNIIQPIKRVLVEREVCKDPRGCELLKGGHCPDCVMDFVWE